MDNIVEVRGLRKEFRNTVAIDNLNFDVKQGEILGFLGANGAGKTTTIFTLLGLITPTQGTIRIFGKDFQSSRVEILRRMNFASAYQQLPYNLLVWEISTCSLKFTTSEIRNVRSMNCLKPLSYRTCERN